jgi:hypothetical protein
VPDPCTNKPNKQIEQVWINAVELQTAHLDEFALDI